MFDSWDLTKLLSGPYDICGAYLTILAGTGGTDAQDWAEMLENMYMRYAQNQGYSSKIIDRMTGEEAGIKSSTLQIEGR